MRDGQRKIRSRPACSGPDPGAESPAPARQRPESIKDVFIGRQGIFDRNMGIYGYELLYRSSEQNQAGDFDGDHATSHVAIGAFLEMGLDHVVGSHLAFLNLTRNFLTGEHPVPFPADKVVLEVLEDIAIDPGLIEGVRALAAQGYTIALDDCMYSQRLCGLLEFANIVKIDVRQVGMDNLAEHVELFRQYPVKLVAEKVETQEEYDICRDLGFEYFQGYFLCRPRVLIGQTIPDNKLNMLRLLARLQDPDIKTGELEQVVSQDLSLSYKLLRYINSAFFALPKKIESIHQALVYIGNRAIKTWVTLLALRGAESRANALTTTALARARMCELLAAHKGVSDTETFFTVGLFSVVDAMMDMPMERIMKSLPFSSDVCKALLEQRGPLGEALSCVMAYERGDWNRVASAGFDAGAVSSAYLDSIAWADNVSRNMN